MTETDTETSLENVAEARLERQEQVKKFRKLRERIEGLMQAAKRALKNEDIDMAAEKLKEPRSRLEELQLAQDRENPIQVRSVSRVGDELKRLEQRVESAINKRNRVKKPSRPRVRDKDGSGIPTEDLDWILNALYLIRRDHSGDLSELHLKKCETWAEKFKRQDYADEKALVTLNNYVRRYKLSHLFDRDEVNKRVAMSKD